MPALLAVPWLVPLITGIGAATSIGTTAYDLATAPGSPSTPTTTSSASAQAQAAQAAQQKAAVLAQAGNTQAQTGGSLTPTNFLADSAKSAGLPSDLNSLQQYLAGSGSSGGSSAPISGGTITPGASQQSGGDPNLQQLSDLLKAA